MRKFLIQAQFQKQGGVMLEINRVMDFTDAQAAFQWISNYKELMEADCLMQKIALVSETGDNVVVAMPPVALKPKYEPYTYTPPAKWWNKIGFEQFEQTSTYKSGVEHDTFT